MSHFELAQPEETILREIADRRLRQRHIAQTYAILIRQCGPNGVDWKRINRAIIERWSVSGLERIKHLAWSGKCFEGVPMA